MLFMLSSHRLHAPRLRPGTQTGGLRARAVVPVRRYLRRTFRCRSVVAPCASKKESCCPSFLGNVFPTFTVHAFLYRALALGCGLLPSAKHRPCRIFLKSCRPSFWTSCESQLSLLSSAASSPECTSSCVHTPLCRTGKGFSSMASRRTRITYSVCHVTAVH